MSDRGGNCLSDGEPAGACLRGPVSDGEGGCPTLVAGVCLTRSTSASKPVPPHNGSESYPDGAERCGRGLARLPLTPAGRHCAGAAVPGVGPVPEVISPL